jgi:hypothetical protein
LDGFVDLVVLLFDFIGVVGLYYMVMGWVGNFCYVDDDKP